MLVRLLVLLFFSFANTSADQKIVISKSDMSDEMQKFAIQSATKALSNSTYFTDMAVSIRHEFDNQYGKYWQAIISEGAGFDLWYEKNNLAYFSIDGVNFLIFKALKVE